MLDLVGVRLMTDTLVELPEARRVIHVRVGGDGDERLLGIVPQRVDERAERRDPVPGIDQEIAVSTSDEPDVRQDERVYRRAP